YEGRFRKRRRPSLFRFASRSKILRLDLAPMPSELPLEEDRPDVPIAPPLLFVFPIIASLVLEWFVPTSFVYGTLRWLLGAFTFAIGFPLIVRGFITQKR